MKNYVFFCLVSMVLLGCYPVYKTIRMPMEVVVVDESGKRVEGAEVLRITEQFPAKVPLKFDLIHTDRGGIAIFKSVKEWQMDSLIIHGAQQYSWSFCVSKSGYETVDHIALSDSSSGKINVVLKTTRQESQDCKNWMKD